MFQLTVVGSQMFKYQTFGFKTILAAICNLHDSYLVEKEQISTFHPYKIVIRKLRETP